MNILLVEDELALAASLKLGLEAEHYAVDMESDGNRGLSRARANTYDLIVLDNVLPGKEGPDVCKELREYHISTPVLILSAQSEIARKVLLLNCGADDYLTKPFSPQELTARVRALLRRPRESEEPRLQLADLTLDRETFSATRGARRIALTAKEFILLEYLMKNHGRVVTRGMILEHVWDKDADPFTKSIEIHVMNLRKKIDGADERKLIRTVPNRGYRMTAQ